MKIGKAKADCGYPNKHILPLSLDKNPVLKEVLEGKDKKVGEKEITDLKGKKHKIAILSGSPQEVPILKGSLWYVPDDYNFKKKTAIFTEHK